jgi:hypothetical protein
VQERPGVEPRSPRFSLCGGNPKSAHGGNGGEKASACRCGIALGSVQVPRESALPVTPRRRPKAAESGTPLYFFGKHFYYPLHGEKARFGPKAAARPVSSLMGTPHALCCRRQWQCLWKHRLSMLRVPGHCTTQGNMRVRRYSHLQLHVAVPAYSQVTHSVRVMQLQLPALADICKYRSNRYAQFIRSHTCSLLATQKVPSAILSYIT